MITAVTSMVISINVMTANIMTHFIIIQDNDRYNSARQRCDKSIWITENKMFLNKENKKEQCFI